MIRSLKTSPTSASRQNRVITIARICDHDRQNTQRHREIGFFRGNTVILNAHPASGMNKGWKNPRRAYLVVIARLNGPRETHGNAAHNRPFVVFESAFSRTWRFDRRSSKGFLKAGNRHAWLTTRYRALKSPGYFFGRPCLRRAGMRRDSREPQGKRNTLPASFAAHSPAIDAHRVAQCYMEGGRCARQL